MTASKHHDQPTAIEERVSVTFDTSELWLLRGCVRHELVNQDTWKYPPASADLNDQIAEALYHVETLALTDGALRLSWGDLLVLDYTIPQDAKDVNGKPIGRSILVKSFAARAQLRRGYPYPEVQAQEPSKSEIQQRLRAKGETDAYSARYPD